MKFKRSSMMVLSIAFLFVLVFLGAQLQLPTAFAFPILHFSRVHAVPGLTGTHTWTLGTNACLGSGCHVSSGSPGSAAVAGFPTGMTYTPGTPIPLTVTINDPLGPSFGFELTARLANSTATAAGSWAAGTNSNLGTDVVPVVQGLAFGSNTFNFTWTPPATASGSVNFYLTGWSGSFPSGDAYTAMYTLTAAPAGVAPSVTSANSTTFTAGTAGTFTVTATGTPAPTLGETGTLPGGVTFNASSGVLSGTPTASGTFPITFTAQNGVTPNASQSFTLKVNPAPVAPAITSASSMTFTAGTAGMFTVTATGTPAPTLGETGTLPGGVTFNASTGVLSGTPTASGTFPVTFMAQNGVTPNASQSFTLTVNPAPKAPVITSASSTTFTVGTAGMFVLTATGTPTPTFGETGALPNGVKFSAGTGVLSGTPTASGTFPITFTATNGISPSASQNFTLTVNPSAPMNQPPVITSANSTTFTVGTAGMFTVTASGTPTPTLGEMGSLPGGVTFNAATGMLSGTPTASGTFPITFTATNGVSPSASQNFTLTVNAAPPTTGSLTVSPTSLTFNYSNGSSASGTQYLKVASTTAGIQYTVSKSGGSWLMVSPTQGKTPGTITVSVNAYGMSTGTNSGSVTVSDSGGDHVSVQVTLNVTASSGGGTGTTTIYAQPYVHYGTSSSSSGGIAALWVNGLGDTSQYNNQGLVLSMSASEPAGSWAGAHILNVSGPLTEIGYDYRVGSECTTTSPRFLVVTTDAVTHVVGGCSVAGATVQTDTPTKGWNRVRFNLADPAQTNPVITPGMQVQSITLVMDQAPGSVAGASGGLAVIDNIDVNGTLITSGTNYSHDD